MDELLKKVAEMRGMPASLIERSAQARADKTGATLEEVLTEWAGGEAAAPKAEADSPAPEPAAEPAAADEPESTEPSVPGAITLDYLISLAAEAKRMPPKLIQSSAGARSEHSGESIESVLAGWAGVDLDDLKEQAAATPAEPEQPDTPPAASTPEEPAAPADETAAPAAAPVAAAAAAAMTLDQLLDKVAELKGMPASLTKRSAEARAKKTGEPLEAVLLDWAGLDADTVVAESGAAPAAEAPAPAAAEPTDAPEEAAPEAAEVEVIEGEAPEARADDDEADGSPAATSSRYPVWLAAAFVLIPILAVMYILVAPDGPDCGTGGQLLVDPSTGNAVNCDGSAYGSSTVDNFAAGAAVYTQCVACHATDGSGGVGPAFTGGAVLATFPADSCTDHIDWVELGTGGWPDSTYGATAKPVGGGGVMPPFGTTLDEVALAQVVLYERVQFGGQDLAAAEVDCGLVTEEEAAAASAG
jgi:mono/diheme cytochrome c family protein